MNKKRAGIIIAIVVIVVAAAGGGAWFLLKGNSGGSNEDKVFVQSVSSLTSTNSGVQNRYAGVVEPQESWKVNKDSEREIKEVFVEEGDMVEEGSPLFEYDMEEVKGELSQAELDLEEMQNEITDCQTQIAQLTKERNAASADEKYQYTADIQEKENSIKQTQYNIESKKAEMEKKRQSIDNAVVKSKLAGVIKSIKKSNSDSASEDDSYMTVLAVGDFRVKGTVSETNVQMLFEEQPVILRSRIDEEQTWKGTISKIDTQNEESNNNDDMYVSDSSVETATKYPFYIKLESTEGLIMGQHLFIELDEGQMEQKEGIWLFDSYIVQEEGSAYVWAANGRDKLEKRTVELGEYDENLCEYQILSGLTEEDFIASPMEGLYEGVTTVTDEEEVDYNAPLYNQEEEFSEDGEMSTDGEMIEDGEGTPIDGEMPEGEMPAGASDEDGEASGEDKISEEGGESDGMETPGTANSQKIMIDTYNSEEAEGSDGDVDQDAE